MVFYCNHCMFKLAGNEVVCPMCGRSVTNNAPVHHLLPGTILNNKFYVGMALGEGGFGITYIGYDMNLEMKVAIKEFYPNGYVNRSNTISPYVNDSVTEDRRDFFEKGRERFLNEARVLARFSGEPGIVDVRDFFEENNTAYIIMEYLEGIDLKNYLNQYGTLTPEQTVALLMPVMNSLKKIHAQGLIHRDISPDNIMLVGDKVKLLDFGAARNVSAAANKSLSVMLKPGYAPEEQYRSKGEQGPWTDVYALCATMYKCITGITPDDATQRVYSDEVKPPSTLGISIAPEIEAAIMRGMSVQQKDRYQSIEELLGALQTNSGVAGWANQMAVNNAEGVQTAYNERNYEREMSMNTNYNGYYTNNTGKPQSDKTTKIILGVIAGFALIIILLLLLLILVFSNKNSEEKDTNQSGSVSMEETISEIVESEPVETKAEESEITESKEPESEIAEVESEETKVEESNTEETPAEETELVMSDELFDFTFELDGVVYQLPCSYQKFVDNGWTISERGYNSETVIGGNSYAYYYMSKDGCKIKLYSYNLSGNAKKLKDCRIGGIECEQYYEVPFKMAKGIEVGATSDVIKETFGVPNESNSGSSWATYIYRVEDSYDNFVNFYFDLEGKYSSIELRNFIATEEDKTETNTERPAYLDAYQAPAELGTDIFASIVGIDGDVYQLPLPMSCFLDNGWEITQKPGSIVSGGTEYSIRLEKDGKKMYASVVNGAEYQTTVENCVVYKLSVDEYDGAELILPEEDAQITLGMTKEALEEILPEGFEYYESTYSYSYTYYEYAYGEGERDFSIYISVSVETGLVSGITISCETWSY